MVLGRKEEDGLGGTDGDDRPVVLSDHIREPLKVIHAGIRFFGNLTGPGG